MLMKLGEVSDSFIIYSQFRDRIFMGSRRMGSKDAYRSYLDGEEERNTKWRFGAPPNYDLVNKLFEQGRTKVQSFSLLFL